jgi:hypothetical protein
MDESSASFLDKTDWRITLHRKLESCVNAEGTFYYIKTVQSLISAYSATYPNWNAKADLQVKINELEQVYTTRWEKWLRKNSTAKRYAKESMELSFKIRLHKDIFEYIKNTCASKRMLLWGTKKIKGGTEMEHDG